MSGIIGSKLNIRGSGLVAKLGTDGQVLTSAGAGKSAVYEDLAGGISWQSVVTGSTMTAVAGNGYPINTTSNTCTITLPASASAGDEIIFTDYARYWGTNKIIIDSNGLNYQGDADTFTVEYTTDGQSLHIIYADATKGWIPINDDDVTDVPLGGNNNGIFAYGYSDASGSPANISLSNLVSSSGVIATDVTGVGTARRELAACEYGGDKGIFGYGTTTPDVSLTNLVNSSGVVGSDVSGVGTARRDPAACGYGEDKGIFGYGTTGSVTAVTNLVSNSGVVATDTSGVGTARAYIAACEYGGDKGIFGYGNPSYKSMTNLVSNVGVVATDTTGVGTGRADLAACGYDSDKGMFAYGNTGSVQNISNLVSNVGVVATDTTGVGTAREQLMACEYGKNKAIFAYGHHAPGGSPTYLSMSNLVATSGVIASDVSGVGTVRKIGGACSYN